MAINVSASQAVAGLDLITKVVGSSNTLKYWNGASWEAKPLKYWNGTAWEAKPLKYWNGSEWVGGETVTQKLIDIVNVFLQTDVTATEPGESVSVNIQNNVSTASAIVELIDITLRVTPSDTQSVVGIDVAQHVDYNDLIQLQTDSAIEPNESVSISISGEVTDSALVTLS